MSLVKKIPMAKICALAYGLGFLTNVSYYTLLMPEMVSEKCAWDKKKYTADKHIQAALEGICIGTLEGVFFPLKILSCGVAALTSNEQNISPKHIITVPICKSNKSLNYRAMEIACM